MRSASRRTSPLFGFVLVVSLLAAPGAVAAPGSPGDVTPDIVGGDEATPGAWPFMAEFRLWVSPTSFTACGGSLVAPTWVMTAAHCVVDDGVVADPADLEIRMGVHNRWDPPPERHDVVEIRVHPQYVAKDFLDRLVNFNDVALLRLDSASAYATVPIADRDGAGLWSPGTEATVLGWGLTVWNDPGSSSDVLLEATVPITTDETAEAMFGSRFDPEIQIPAGEAGTDTCGGDSGGPLLVPDGAGGWVVAGITSVGPEVCGSGTPARYTEVAAFHRWITGTVSGGVAVVLDGSGAGGDRFGFSVGLDGDALIVGAPYDDHPGYPLQPDPGSASIFTGAGTGWSLAKRIGCSPSNVPNPQSQFRCGYAVAVDGDLAVIGAPQWPWHFSGTGWIPLGKALVYERIDSSWSNSGAQLESFERNNWYGRAVAVDGDRVVVGAPFDGVGDGESMGAAFVYDRPGWNETRLEIAGAPTDLQLGSSVAVSGDVVVLGAKYRAYVFREDGGSWPLIQNIYTGSGVTEVAFDGVHLAVGTPGAASGGEVEVYRWDGSSFAYVTTLQGPDRVAFDSFGDSVAVAGDRIVVGADGRDDLGAESGAAYVFAWDGAAWSLERTLLAPDGAAGDDFGSAVAIQGRVVAVGAPKDDNRHGSNAGAVYVYDLDAASGDTVGPIVAKVAADPDTVAAGETVTVSATVADDNTGGSLVGGATYSIDGGPAVEMEAGDGSFDETTETVVAVHAATADGTFRVCVTGRDAAGNPGDARCTEFTVATDGDAPAVSGVAADPNPVVAGATVALTATVDDSSAGGSTVAGAEVTVGGGAAMAMDPADGAFDEALEEVALSVPATWGIGSHQVCVTGRDAAGNESGPVCTSLLVIAPDPQAPVATAATATPNPVVTGASVTVTARIDDSATGGSPIAGADLTVDGGGAEAMNPADGSFDEPTEDVTLTRTAGWGIGTHQVCVTGRDGAGNTSDPVCLSLEVIPPDAEPPAVEITITPNPAPTGVPLTLRVVADDTASGGSPIGDWTRWYDSPDSGDLLPADGAVDSPYEVLTATLPAQAEPGRGHLCVSIHDAADNQAFECFTFEVYHLDVGVVARTSGNDRYATAAALSAGRFEPFDAAVAYIAVGDNFPDALAAGPAAAARGGPILLVTKDTIPAATRTELSRLWPDDIVVVGGSGVISDAVVEELEWYTFGSVTRIAGSDRYQTAAAISASAFDPGVAVAYVAVGDNFPDALAAGPIAGRGHGPILLTTTTGLPAATRTELGRLQPASIVVVGGPAVVSDAVVASLAAYSSGPVTRLAGADRYATAAAMCLASYEPGTPVVYVAVGDNFPDALAAGPIAGINGGPVLLTATGSIPAATRTELARLRPAGIVVVGGPGVISPDVAAGLAAYLGP